MPRGRPSGVRNVKVVTTYGKDNQRKRQHMIAKSKSVSYIPPKKGYRIMHGNTMSPKVLYPIVKPKLFTTLPFEGAYIHTVGLGANSFTQIFRANSIFDPDFSNVTRNTTVDGYTLASRIYQRYIVHGVYVTVKITQAVANVYPMRAVVGATNANAGFATSTYVEDIKNRNGSISKLLAQNGNSNSVVTLKKFYKLRDILGLTKEQYRCDQNNWANIGANPTNTAFILISLGVLPDGGLAAQSCHVDIDLKYKVELSDVIEYVTDL